MAASAVPRLIAVVVLPTPPFWLATAMTRGPGASPASDGWRSGIDLRLRRPWRPASRPLAACLQARRGSLRRQVEVRRSWPAVRQATFSVERLRSPMDRSESGIVASHGRCAYVRSTLGLSSPSSGRAPPRCSHRTRPARHRSASILQYLAASVNSAATSWPFGNRPTAPRVDQRKRLIAEDFQWRQGPALTTSILSPKLSPQSSIRSGMHHRRHAGDADGLAQKCGLLAVALDQVNFGARPARPMHRRPGIAGKAAARAEIHPTVFASGTRSRSCSESATCRVQSFGIVDGAIRLVVCCHCSSSATKRFKPLLCFT